MKNSLFNCVTCKGTQKGVALLAVLAMLTVLAIMSIAFIAYMSIESSSGALSIAKVQSDLMAQSALEHALGQLRQDVSDEPAWDYRGEPWASAFKPKTKNDSVDIDGVPATRVDEAGAEDGRWIYVTQNGEVIGRYAIMIEDEAAKINANVATSLGKDSQDEGYGTFEIMLTDGKERGLPVSLAFGKRILNYRYGTDDTPGQVAVDDNYTASRYGADRIDNNANGKIDEGGEGLDEQLEYNPLRPAWDDRSFASINEVLDKCSPREKYSKSAVRLLQKYATTYSRSREMYYDPRTEKLQKQVNLNVGSRDQVRKLIRRANAEAKFEPSTRNMLGLVANIIDYRDENHVLTTVGNEYGVEGVNFNEIMANDGSYSMEADTGAYPDGFSQYETVHRYGLWYNYGDSPIYGFPVDYVSNLGGGGSALVLGKRTRFTSGATVRLNDEPRRSPNRSRWSDFKSKIRSNYGGYPNNLWKNATLILYNQQNAVIGLYPIIGNSKKSIQVGINNSDSKMTYAILSAAPTNTWYAKIDTLWEPAAAAWSVFPSAADLWSFPTQTDSGIPVPKELYYYAYVGEQNFNDNVPVPGGWPYGDFSIGTQPWEGFSEYMDLDGDQNASEESRMEILTQADLQGSEMRLPDGEDRMFMKRYPYLNGRPVQARNGFVNMLVSTGQRSGYYGGIGRRSNSEAFKNKNTFDVVYIMRPDIVELHNISDRNISLRNWRVVINTGSYADQVASMDSAMHFDRLRGRQYDNPNPVIKANGYFYLTNKRDIFDYEYGSSKDGSWGNNINEEYPCYELPDHLWGVRFKITRVVGNRLYVQGADWKDDQMKFEMQEIHSTKKQNRRNGISGIRKSVYRSGNNWLEAQPYIWWPYDGVTAGDDLLLVGMPRAGGFLSMTLKNEYGQIAARTIEYGSLEPEELNFSTEKFDPTHYTWIKNRNPTFGGREEQARNTSTKLKTQTKAYVKDSPFASVGEVRKVRKASDWENVGMSRGGKQAANYLKAIGKYFTTHGVRLDAEEEDAHVSGWSPAFGKAEFAGKDKLQAKDVRWEPDIWSGSKVRITSGDQKGEVYIVERNTQNSLVIGGYSVSGGKSMRVSAGDLFSIGPGYSTALYYTRRNNDEGIWEWKKKGLEKQMYGLYVFGLNDSIKTTEFLEENYNANLSVSVFNYETDEFEDLPLKSEREIVGDIDDPYRFVGSSQQLNYDKSDGIFCGQILPQNISSIGGIKLKIVPHNLDETKCSGFAWFDYAYLTPGTVNGKININTASARVLSALKNVTPEIAKYIVNGTDQEGRNILKPYHNITDILDVKDISPEEFSAICNLICTRSDQYRIQILAQAINDSDRNGSFSEITGDKVMSQSKIDVIVDRNELSDPYLTTKNFKFLSRQ